MRKADIGTALEELHAYLVGIGSCGDGNCIVLKPKGMHTNGGCRCSSDRVRMERLAYVHNRFAEQIRVLHAQGTGSRIISE